MSSNEHYGADKVTAADATEEQEHEVPRPRPPVPAEPDALKPELPNNPSSVDRAQTDVAKHPNLDKQKLIALGACLLAAVLFFIFVSLFGHHRPARNTAQKQPAQQAQHTSALQQRGSMTPLMDVTPHNATEDDNDIVRPSDIQRMSTPSTEGFNTRQGLPAKPSAAGALKPMHSERYHLFKTHSRNGKSHSPTQLRESHQVHSLGIQKLP